MESNSLKVCSSQMVHSIELKFCMHIIDHCSTYCIDLGEFSIDRFLTGVQKYFWYITAKEVNYQNYANVQTVLSIKFKFDMYIIHHLPTYCIAFGDFRINSFFFFFNRSTKGILIHYSLRSQIIRIMLMSKRCFQLSSNLICIL